MLYLISHAYTNNFNIILSFNLIKYIAGDVIKVTDNIISRYQFNID